MAPIRRAPAQLPIDPRIAARWVSVRHERDHRRRRVAVVVLALLTVAVGAAIAARSPLLAARHVVVRGLGHTSRDAVVSAAGLERVRPMIELDPNQIRRRVLALPWVDQVSVRRDWPTTVAVVLTERVAVAEVNGPGGEPTIVDTTGRVLAVGGDAQHVLSSPHSSLPRLVGIASDGPAGSTLRPSARGVLDVLSALERQAGASATAGSDRSSAAGQGSAAVATVPAGTTSGAPAWPSFEVVAVTRAPDGTVSASLQSGQITVLFGSTDQLESKLVALRSVLAQVAPGTAATIDVEVAQVPVLTNGKKSTSFSTTQRG